MQELSFSAFYRIDKEKGIMREGQRQRKNFEINAISRVPQMKLNIQGEQVEKDRDKKN